MVLFVSDESGVRIDELAVFFSSSRSLDMIDDGGGKCIHRLTLLHTKAFLLFSLEAFSSLPSSSREVLPRGTT